ncbi:MAG TPA: hypothetical protein VFJ58_19875 [Armatimonadota bacterium]|nr:hypothetical protein [Armatimonadota bacterium]
MGQTWTVLIIDMNRYRDPEGGERLVGGFPDRDLAIEFARRRVRSSVEELRAPQQTDQELREHWFAFGEDSVAIDADYAGSHQLDYFIRHPATSDEIDWLEILRRAGIDETPASELCAAC